MDSLKDRLCSNLCFTECKIVCESAGDGDQILKVFPESKFFLSSALLNTIIDFCKLEKLNFYVSYDDRIYVSIY